MPDVITSRSTSRSCEDVFACAREIFAAEDWRQTSQHGRSVTFRGKVRLPWYLLALIAAGLLTYVVPGIVVYLLCARHACRFTSIVVTATSIRGGTQVAVHYPPLAEGLARRFVSELPPLEALPGPRRTAQALPGLQLRLTGSERT
jgi:hypothetical protein